MPPRRAKQTATKTATSKKTTSKGRATTPRETTKPKGTSKRQTGAAAPTTRVRASWKPVTRPTKDYVLNSFDAAVRLVMHKVPDRMRDDVQSVFIQARNKVAVSLEVLKVPPSKLDYSHLSSSLTELRKLQSQLELRKTSLAVTLQSQERELQELENEQKRLQNFGKVPKKHHPFVIEPMENELLLNIDTMK